MFFKSTLLSSFWEINPEDGSAVSQWRTTSTFTGSFIIDRYEKTCAPSHFEIAAQDFVHTNINSRWIKHSGQLSHQIVNTLSFLEAHERQGARASVAYGHNLVDIEREDISKLSLIVGHFLAKLRLLCFLSVRIEPSLHSQSVNITIICGVIYCILSILSHTTH